MHVNFLKRIESVQEDEKKKILSDTKNLYEEKKLIMEAERQQELYNIKDTNDFHNKTFYKGLRDSNL